MIYLDNGPIAKSKIFQEVMRHLEIDWRVHVAAGKDGRRVTARAKGKVERPFRTVKETHEVLYHFHQPATETEANQWLLNYLVNYKHVRTTCRKDQVTFSVSAIKKTYERS